MWCSGWDYMRASGGEEEFLAANRHFYFSFCDVGDLFVDMCVLRQYTSFFNFPESEGGLLAMDKSPGEAGEEFFCRKVGDRDHMNRES